MENRGSYKEILELEKDLKLREFEVICIIDLNTGFIYNKCSDFTEHVDRNIDRLFDWDYNRL